MLNVYAPEAFLEYPLLEDEKSRHFDTLHRAILAPSEFSVYGLYSANTVDVLLRAEILTVGLWTKLVVGLSPQFHFYNLWTKSLLERVHGGQT